MSTGKRSVVATGELLVLALNACVPAHTWAPGPGVNAANYDKTSAQCSLMARHSGSDFVVVGSQSYVTGAVVGHNISEANRTQADFNDCMLAQGWKIADQPTTPPAPTAPAVLPPAPPSAGGPYNGRWVSDVPLQGSCPASHMTIDVRGSLIDGNVVNPAGTFKITGSIDPNGNGTIQIVQSRGVIKFSENQFVADYENLGCGKRHAVGARA
jgi:hypothetical protein